MKFSLFDSLFGGKPNETEQLTEIKPDFKPIVPAADILEFSYPEDSPFFKAEQDIHMNSSSDLN